MKKAGTLLHRLTDRARAIAILAFVTMLPPGSALAQCAMCGTALQDNDGPLTRGLFWSVVFLISLPYSIVGGFAAFLYWRYRQARSHEAARPALRLVTAGGSAIGKEDGR